MTSTVEHMTTTTRQGGGGAHGRLHRIFGAGPWVCFYCGRGVACSCDRTGHAFLGGPIPPIAATLDHCVPTSRDGSNDRDNIVVACHRCNTSKGTQLFPDEWVPDADHRWLCGVGDWPIARRLGLEALGLTVVLSSLQYTSTVGELARATGTAPAHVRRALRLLDSAGIAVVSPRLTSDGWRRVFLPAVDG